MTAQDSWKPPPQRPPESSLPDLLERLELEQLDRDFFVGDPGQGKGRLFGGLVAAQSVVAASRTVGDGTALHSLHAYFLRPGSYGAPIRYTVDRIRDGRTFTTRRVVALQNGEAIFNLSASFARPEEGFTHQQPMPETPGPDGLPEMSEVRARWANLPPPKRPVFGAMEMRLVDDTHGDPSIKLEPVRNIWIRLTETPPEDPMLRTALLVYISDRTLMSTSLRPLGRTPGGDTMVASLDHSVWIHRPPALDGWFLYSARSPVAHAGRALVHGAMFTPDGIRIASTTQEGLIRGIRKNKK